MTGEIRNNKDESVAYEIFHEWNIIRSAECDQQWSEFNLETLQKIETLQLSDNELELILSSFQSQDFHWRWTDKSMILRGKEYEWFYLYANGKAQGICVIYHPKASALESGEIFYVEYIAVAPWNRKSDIHEKQLKSVGTVLLQSALNFSVNTLGLRPGFSLHSLPQAKGYYEKLKMVHLSDLDKPGLNYFELPENEAAKLTKVS